MSNSLLLVLAQAAPAGAPEIEPMSRAGWTFLLVSVGFVVALTAWCFYRVLKAPREE